MFKLGEPDHVDQYSFVTVVLDILTPPLKRDTAGRRGESAARSQSSQKR
jgi:hypothetical protein